MTDRAALTMTQSVQVEAPVAAVVAILADPTRVPQWAPALADEIRGDSASGWKATKDGRDFSLRVARVATNGDAGTVDYLRQVAPGREGGAYLRGIPRPGAAP